MNSIQTLDWWRIYHAWFFIATCSTLALSMASLHSALPRTENTTSSSIPESKSWKSMMIIAGPAINLPPPIKRFVSFTPRILLNGISISRSAGQSRLNHNRSGVKTRAPLPRQKQHSLGCLRYIRRVVYSSFLSIWFEESNFSSILCSNLAQQQPILVQRYGNVQHYLSFREEHTC